jgi:hypothetical protein
MLFPLLVWFYNYQLSKVKPINEGRHYTKIEISCIIHVDGFFISFAPPKEPSRKYLGFINELTLRVRRRQMPTSAKSGARYTSLYALPI